MIWSLIVASKAQTPAKAIMGMRVVDGRTGVPLPFGNYVFMRGLLGGVEQWIAVTLNFGVQVLMPLWDSRNQSIAAKVSNSVVVDV